MVSYIKLFVHSKSVTTISTTKTVAFSCYFYRSYFLALNFVEIVMQMWVMAIWLQVKIVLSKAH